MGNLFELVDKKCPYCGKDSLTLALLADAKKIGMVEDIYEISIYCNNTDCPKEPYIKTIAKRRD